MQGKRKLKLPPCAFKSERCARMWRETDKNKKVVFAAAITAILLIIFIIVSSVCGQIAVVEYDLLTIRKHYVLFILDSLQVIT